MNRAGKILLCLASGLACTALPRVAEAALPSNPYALVVTRNVFGLNPPVPFVAPIAPTDPPPKITPNGILSIFGHTQVLFKAAVAKPGQPPKDESYNLSEGQSEDGIEVVRIDEKNGIVTFNNHGTVQELPLIAGAASGGEPPAAAGPINLPGRVPIPGANGAFGTSANSNNGNISGGANNNSLTMPSVQTRVDAANQQPAMPMEEQTILIEAQRLQAQNEGDPVAKIFPPTELTPPPDSTDGSTPAAQ